jgi:hypothetical protein
MQGDAIVSTCNAHAHRTSIDKFHLKKPLWRYSHKWIILKKYLRINGCENVDYIKLSYLGYKEAVLVNTIMKFPVP